MLRPRFIPLLLIVAITIGSVNAHACVGRKLVRVAVEADRRDQGWQDSKAAMEMTLRNRQGETSTRRIRSRSLEVQGDGDKSLIKLEFDPVWLADNPLTVADLEREQEYLANTKYRLEF